MCRVLTIDHGNILLINIEALKLFFSAAFEMSLIIVVL